MSKTVLSIAILLVLAGGGFLWFQGQRVPTGPGTVGDPELEARLADLRRIKDLTLDTSILQDPLFRSLSAAPETPQNPSAPGRENPFLPVVRNAPSAPASPPPSPPPSPPEEEFPESEIP